MYSQVYGTAGPVIVNPAKPATIIDQRGPAATGRLLSRNKADRQVIMVTRNAGKPDEHVQVRVELVQPTCEVCTGQHRGECY